MVILPFKAQTQPLDHVFVKTVTFFPLVVGIIPRVNETLLPPVRVFSGRTHGSPAEGLVPGLPPAIGALNMETGASALLTSSNRSATTLAPVLTVHLSLS